MSAFRHLLLFHHMLSVPLPLADFCQGCVSCDLKFFSWTGRKAGQMRCHPGRSAPSGIFGREVRVCAVAGSTGVKSKHVQRRGEPITYDDIRMTVWRDWM